MDTHDLEAPAPVADTSPPREESPYPATREGGENTPDTRAEGEAWKTPRRDGRTCAGRNSRGEPCRSTSLEEHEDGWYCGAHRPGSPKFGTAEVARKGGRASGKARKERVERARAAPRTVREALAQAAERLSAEIEDAYESAIRTGDPDDLRRAEAAERLLSRVFGRPVTPTADVTGSHEPGLLAELRRKRQEREDAQLEDFKMRAVE